MVVVTRAWPLTALFLAGAAVFAACGGSGGGTDDGLQGLSDPASVPTSTRIAGEILYKINPDGISVEGAVRTATPGGDDSQDGTSATSYTVLPGDTCSGIASQFGITVEELRAANITINSGCTNLAAGALLRIPATQVSGQPTASSGGGDGTNHTVEAGQGCGEIAAINGVTLEALLTANGMSEDDCTTLQIGQVLQLP